MASVVSWIFKNNQGQPAFRYEGKIEDIPGLKWLATKDHWACKHFNGKQPCVLHNGMLHFGEPEVIWMQGDGAPCSTNCRKAMNKYCQCSCQGKNHGIENRDMANAVQEEDVVYIGWD